MNINQSFRLLLHSSSGMVVGSQKVYEVGFLSNTSSVLNIYTAGGAWFSYATYNLTVSDGGESHTANGTKYP